jgi:hypothetical protein
MSELAPRPTSAVTVHSLRVNGRAERMDALRASIEDMRAGKVTPVEDMRAGRTQPLADAFADIRRDLNLPQA